jgi:hypothetical protein
VQWSGRAKRRKLRARSRPHIPGYLGAQDTYCVGIIKSVGRIYQEAYLGTKVAKLYDRPSRSPNIVLRPSQHMPNATIILRLLNGVPSISTAYAATQLAAAPATPSTSPERRGGACTARNAEITSGWGPTAEILLHLTRPFIDAAFG